ncbi:amidase [Colletotrichum graminicola]|uniref:Amidase n=1 Tax=Colletotrichum graminicola (strain M1.001 / M2 / FGSC 10212) TaxID=645133 RepID=E3Q3S2_COLGM|nr:amidase [Colletotrichum graminicola M1.001]EFQ25674.1 amidase [Colletotrichum graminicola M1.001]WDK10988.1 amidase [Colletotrichum graminicola]
MDLANLLVALCATTKYALELLPKVARVFVSLDGTLNTNTFISETQDWSFSVGNAHYLAVASNPVLSIPYRLDRFSSGPITYISALSGKTTGEELRQVINDSFRQDDVFIEGFLNDILVSAAGPDDLDVSVIDYLGSLGSKIIYADTDGPNTCGSSTLTPCPLFATKVGNKLSLSKVQLLYPDTYRTFVTGTYESNGTYKSFTQAEINSGYPLIPVPSRLYSIEDRRPLAGQRIGVKDIYDLEGIQTTAGSLSYVAVNGVARKTAPALQRIIDLGGIVVGKQKTAQFASPAYPWNWNDEYYPRNPRGDTYLSCSGSSSGAGCSIAAYDWLDFAIGTDTGMSVRQPAAFSGTYGNRPSQGMILMDNIVTNAYNTDTAGVIARDPGKWASFAKAWYGPSLHEQTSLNGLPALSLPDDHTFPKRIRYPVDHLPLQNPAAEAILQKFLSDASTALGATIENFNLSATIEDVAGRPLLKVLDDLLVLWTHDLIKETAKPLLAKHAPVFPQLDEPYRQIFHSLTVKNEVYKAAMTNRTRDAAAWHEKVLFSTDQSCSESILIYDIGTGGMPSFRERDLNNMPGAALPAEPTGPGAASMVSSYFGDVDYTIPLGQVSYFSNITYQAETMPVTVNIVAKRGCDFVLFNMVNELAHRGIVKTVLTGQTAFKS